MSSYDNELKATIRTLRKRGTTYSEIQKIVGLSIPKSTLSHICKDVVISEAGLKRINSIISSNRSKARIKAVRSNKDNFDSKIMHYKSKNKHITELMQERDAQLVALSMLYLGEGAKWKNSRAPKLASTNPDIITLYINLLKTCFDIPLSSLKVRIQHRADQDPKKLVEYWSRVTKISEDKFYKCYMDKRTTGKPTKKKGYMGVCTIMSSGTHIQLELEQIADIIVKSLGGIGAVG